MLSTGSVCREHSSGRRDSQELKFSAVFKLISSSIRIFHLKKIPFQDTHCLWTVPFVHIDRFSFHLCLLISVIPIIWVYSFFLIIPSFLRRATELASLAYPSAKVRACVGGGGTAFLHFLELLHIEKVTNFSFSLLLSQPPSIPRNTLWLNDCEHRFHPQKHRKGCAQLSFPCAFRIRNLVYTDTESVGNRT